MGARPPLPPQPRARTLAAVEALIAEEEARRDAYRRTAARLTAAREDQRRAVTMLRATKLRLEQLRKSREVLLSGDEGRDEQEEEGDDGREEA